MAKYVVNRLLLSIPMALAVLTLVFFVIRVIPGDPAVAALGDYASEAAVQKLRARMGLDDPLLVQYFRFIGGLLRGDLGVSLINGKPLGEQIAHALPYTLQLMAASVILGTIIGIPLGVITAVHRNGIIDYAGRLLALIGLSVPGFYFAILLILVFSVKLQLLPAIGGGDLRDPVSSLRHLVLPAVTLGLLMVASTTRLTRSAMLNVLAADYVRTARAKGLGERAVIYRHALRSALLPIISLIGLWIVSLSGGALVMEVVFSRPGLGKMMVGGIMQRDYTTVESVAVVFTLFVALINLITDLVYAMVDPRIRE